MNFFINKVKYVIYSAPAAIVNTALILLVYYILRKVGIIKTKLTIVRAAAIFLLVGWMISVYKLTMQGRGHRGGVNLTLFGDLRSTRSADDLEMIIYNILMFVPLGALLPLILKRAEKLYFTGIASLAASLAIELYQLITRCGIFELDDIIDNTAGGIFGYFLIMALILSLRAKRPDISALLRIFIVPAAMALLIGAAVMI